MSRIESVRTFCRIRISSQRFAAIGARHQSRLSCGMAASQNGVDERAFEFLCAVIHFARTIRPEPGVRRLIDQLVAAAGSIAANREEATSASSRREFKRFNEISLRSAKESVLWLRACDNTGLGAPDKARVLLDEARQLANILAAIVISTKRNGL